MKIFGTTIGSDLVAYFILAGVALVLGALIALSYTVKNKRYSKSFVLALFAMPVAVMTLLLLVARNSWGAAIAIGGIFALVRFRSAPATAKELVSIFMSMIVGVAVADAKNDANTLVVAAIFTAVSCVVSIVFNTTKLGENRKALKTLRITIPESLDYNDVFEDLFEKYTAQHELVRVKTTNMGSMFQLTYEIVLKDAREEQAMINDLRCRNGNLDIICAKVVEDEKAL